MNEKIVESLTNECKSMLKNTRIYSANYYEEILEKVLSSNCSIEDKIKLLTQLYRYGYYNNVKTAIDPRVDNHMKYDILKNIGEAADKGSIGEYSSIISEHLNKMRDIIDNPVLFMSKEIEFLSKNPGVRF